MLKICICVSGQVRDTDDGLLSVRSFLPEADVTYVFSVWDQVARKTGGALLLLQNNRIFSEAALSVLPWRWFDTPHLRRLVEICNGGPVELDTTVEQKLRRLFPQAVVDVEPADLLDLTFDAHRSHDPNSLRMLYKVWRCNEIKRRLEREHGRFDLVFRLRPDALLAPVDQGYLDELRQDGTIHLDVVAPDFVGDAFAVGPSAAMDDYAAVFHEALRQRGDWPLVHQVISQHLVGRGLTCLPYRGYQGFAVGERIGLDGLARGLHALQGTPEWTALHGITLASAELVEALERQDAVAATRLHATLCAAELPPAEQCDGLCFTLGLLFEQCDAPRLASLLYAVALYLRRLDGYSAGFGSIFQRLRASLPPAEAPTLEAFASGLAREPLPDWLAPMIAHVAGPQTALDEVVLAAVVRALVAEPFLAEFRGPGKDLALLRLFVEWSGRTGWQQGPAASGYVLGDILAHGGLAKLAYQAMKPAVALAPQFSDRQRRLSQVCVSLGRQEEALEHAEAALALDPCEETRRHLEWTRQQVQAVT